MKITSIYTQLRNTPQNIAFARKDRDQSETLKQYELNRNKSLDYILSQNDKDFFEYVTKERQKGITTNIPQLIKSKLFVDQFGSSVDTNYGTSFKEYDAFNYPRLYRGIGEKELEALKEGKQIYSQEREEYLGVDVTNTPGGIGYGDYIVKFKLKPNLDLFIGGDYKNNAFGKPDHSMPHIYEWGPLPRGSLSRHTIIAGTYTINDVEEIIDNDTKEVIYSSKDEQIPNKDELLNALHSTDKHSAIKALENLQTYTGHGDAFLEEAKFFLNSDDADIREAYLNAIYNYGSKKDLPMVLAFMNTQENLSPNEIARILNCLEKFGTPFNEDDSISYLIEKIRAVKDTDDLEYLCGNLYGTISQLSYDALNDYSNLKKQMTLDCLPLSKLILDFVSPCEETDKFVSDLIETGDIKHDMKWRRTLKWYSMSRNRVMNTPNPIPDCFYKDERRDEDY